MKSYDKSEFISTLKKAKKLYCSNDLEFGLRLLPTRYALNHKYVQANNDKVISFLIIDLDHDNPLIFEQVGLPAPNFIVADKERRTSHYFYAISPIHKDYVSNQKALLYFSKIQQAYTKALQGDPLYVGMIAKNPLHKNWKTWNANYFYTYDLHELADYVELPQRISKREAIGEGRNCWLFDSVRKFAYKEILFYKANGATEQDFYQLILNRLVKSNVFDSSLPLGFNELKNIAKSISKWTWKNFSAEKFSKIQKVRSHKQKVVIQNKKIINELKHEFS